METLKEIAQNYLDENWKINLIFLSLKEDIKLRIEKLISWSDLVLLSNQDFFRIYNFVNYYFSWEIEQDTNLWEEYCKRLNTN